MFLSKNGCDIGLKCGRFWFAFKNYTEFYCADKNCVVEIYPYRYSPYVIVEKIRQDKEECGMCGCTHVSSHNCVCVSSSEWEQSFVLSEYFSSLLSGESALAWPLVG